MPSSLSFRSRSASAATWRPSRSSTEFLIQSLPVADPRGLVNLVAPGPKPGSSTCNSAGNCDHVFSYPMFLDLAREQDVFAGIAAHRSFGTNLAYRGETVHGTGMRVSGDYFDILGLLYETQTHDPVTFATMAILLGGVALVGAYLPARRAARVDPMALLGEE